MNKKKFGRYNKKVVIFVGYQKRRRKDAGVVDRDGLENLSFRKFCISPDSQ